MLEYDQLAEWYAVNRNPVIGAAAVRRCIAGLEVGSTALDAGCGTGEPVSRLMLEHGLQVFAMDSSAAMVAAYARNFPRAPVICADITAPLPFAQAFAVIVAWGVLVHLDAAGQEQALAVLTAGLAPGGKLLFTAGREAENRSAPMQGVMLHYRHLGTIAYHRILQGQGCTVLDEFPDEAGNYYYLAQKTGLGAQTK